MPEITHDERESLEQEERDLICDLSAAVSDTGDYRMIRCIDALILSDKFWDLIDGIELPYSRDELTEFARARQAKRDRIKEIRKILEG